MSKAKRLRKAAQRTDWDGWLDALQREGDRAAVILGASFLDAWLEELLKSFLVDDDKEAAALLEVDRPLGSFGARISAAYCLGLLSPADLADLRVIKGVRNDFAHMMHGLSFDDQDMKSSCLRLRAAKGRLGGELARSARQVFILSVIVLAQRIALSAEAAKYQRRQIGLPFKPAKMVLDARNSDAPGAA